MKRLIGEKLIPSMYAYIHGKSSQRIKPTAGEKQQNIDSEIQSREVNKEHCFRKHRQRTSLCTVHKKASWPIERILDKIANVVTIEHKDSLPVQETFSNPRLPKRRQSLFQLDKERKHRAKLEPRKSHRTFNLKKHNFRRRVLHISLPRSRNLIDSSQKETSRIRHPVNKEFDQTEHCLRKHRQCTSLRRVLKKASRPERTLDKITNVVTIEHKDRSLSVQETLLNPRLPKFCQSLFRSDKGRKRQANLAYQKSHWTFFGRNIIIEGADHIFTSQAQET